MGKLISVLLFILVFTLPGKAQNYSTEIFKNPPDTIPKIFGKGIITVEDRAEFGLAISPSYDEIFFTLGNPDGGLMFIKKRKDGRWSSPKLANLRGDNEHEMEAFYTPDGEQLYFTSGDTTNTNRIWRSVKENSGWLKAELLNSPVNNTPVFWATFSNTKTMYYTNLAVGKIYCSELINGKYSNTNDIGIDGFQLHPFIAADESYILFNSRRKDCFGGHDIYISFKTKKGNWTEPINLGGQINTDVSETCPSVSPDGNFIFFSRYNDLNGKPDIYWVSAEVIGKLKEKVFKKVKLTEELFEAVDDGNLVKVKEIIKANPELLDSKDRSGSTPLIRSCFNYKTFGRQVEVAKFLIDAGANVNVIDKRKTTALLKASVGRYPDFELIKLLISKGADVNIQERNGLTALHYAALYKDLKIAKLLLDSGADVNISNDYNGPISPSTISGTVLQVAINGQSNEMFQFLIENGAKINIRDSQGNTELHLATFKGNTEQVKFLIEHGIDLNAKNNFNKTALYYAAKHGRRGVAELLIASGADKNTIVETNYGKAKQLSESLEDGEAYIWDLSYKYAVKTKNNLLVFTLGIGIDESSESGLANGLLNANELEDQNLTIFLRHRDYMKLDEKRFTNLAKLTPDVNLISSFQPDFSKMEASEIPDFYLAQPNESFTLDGLKVHPIPALAGGMGYLVEVDGLKIFHAGLHISDDKPEHIAQFREEIDFLKAFDPIDIVMLPTYSHSNRVGAGHEQFLYLIDELTPKEIYLWGANVPEQYVRYAELLKSRNIPIVYPEVSKAAGERHYFKADKLQN